MSLFKGDSHANDILQRKTFSTRYDSSKMCSVLAYALSYGDFKEMIAERGFFVDHSTIKRVVLRLRESSGRRHATSKEHA